MKKKINVKKVMKTIDCQPDLLKKEVVQDSSDVHVEELTEKDKMIQQLEQEKKSLIKQLEENEIHRKGLSPEQLQTRTILSNDEVEGFKKRIQECTDILHNKEQALDSGNGYSVNTMPNKISDKIQVLRKAQNLTRTVAVESANEVTASEKDRLYKRKKELEEYLKKRQAAIGDQNDTTNSYEFTRTVHNLGAYHDDCTKLAQELKNINRILESGETMSSNLDYITPKKSRNV